MKASVGNMEYYTTVNFYPDSVTPGEVFITIAKEGGTIAGLVDILCFTISVALQYGAEWKTIEKRYIHTIFPPNDDENTSLVDGIAKTITRIIDIRKEILK
ncbi:hypothetical protein LCGC14_1573950 [marine sediment metagenome]|uniref:ribonucleoside-diphosphate reductase n=1 Tax=marine sediment metagenome TaxID=412755 RepID=A0A0F9IJ00_9ZZZZ